MEYLVQFVPLVLVLLAAFKWPLTEAEIQNCDPSINPNWRRSHCPFRQKCSDGQTTSEEIGITDLERKAIVHAINMIRDFVASGRSRELPAASNMKQLVWHEEIAEFAVRMFKQQCKTTKTDLLQENPRWHEHYYLNKFEFEAKTETGMLVPVEHLFVESIFEPVFCGCRPDIEHFWPGRREEYNAFAQILWAESSYMGCSRIRFVNDTDVDSMFVCFFGPGFATINQVNDVPVYSVGKTNCNQTSKLYPSLCADKESSKIENPCLDNDFFYAYPRLCLRSTFTIQCQEHALRMGGGHVDDVETTKDENNNLWIIIGSVVGVVILIAIGIVGYFWEDIMDMF